MAQAEAPAEEQRETDRRGAEADRARRRSAYFKDYLSPERVTGTWLMQHELPKGFKEANASTVGSSQQDSGARTRRVNELGQSPDPKPSSDIARGQVPVGLGWVALPAHTPSPESLVARIHCG